MKIIHIGYGDSATGCLKEALSSHGLEGDKAIPSRDDFTQGPISECDAEMATGQRPSYWKMIDHEVHFGLDIDLFYQESMLLLDAVNDVEVILWQGDSCHDILASAWVMTYFRDRNLKWSIIDLAQLSPKDINDGLPPVNLGMFAPEQIPNLYKYKQSISNEALQMYQDLWSVMREQNGAYRIKIGNEISSEGEEYHDEFILSQVPDGFTLATKAIGLIIGQSEHRISDTTVEWRLRHLIREGKVEYQGDLNGMENYSVRKV